MIFFAGSGTTGDACIQLNRRFVLVDNNADSIDVMKERFKGQEIKWETIHSSILLKNL